MAIRLSDLKRQAIGTDEDQGHQAALQPSAGQVRLSDLKPNRPAQPQTASVVAQPDFGTLTEAERDRIEDETRPTFLQGAGQAVRSAGREIKDITTAIRTGAKPAAKLGAELIIEESLPRISDRKTSLRVTEQVMRKSPEIAKETVIDSLKTFGVDVENKRIDKDVSLKKILDKPISSLMDLFVLKNVAQKIGKTAMSAARKTATVKAAEKAAVKRAVTKNGQEIRELKRSLDQPFQTPQDRMVENAETLRRMTVKQLDNQSYVETVGRRLSQNMKRLETRERIKMNKAVSKVKNEPVNKTDILAKAEGGLEQKGLLNEDRSIIPELNKPALRKEIATLQSGEPLTADQLWTRIKNLDDKINYANKKEVDEGLLVLRRAYRDELGRISPEYDTIAKQIYDRLNEFEKKARDIKKLGGGEKFARRFFDTVEERNAFEAMLKRNPELSSGRMLANFRIIDSWHAWNGFFNQNTGALPHFISRGGVPIPVTGPILGAQKRLKKAQISPTGQQVLTAAGQIKRTPQHTIRAAKAQDALEED